MILKIITTSSVKLLIFLWWDNVENYKEVNQYINAAPSNVKFLITSRRDLEKKLTVVKLAEFTVDQAKSYIKKVLKNTVTDEQAIRLANKLGKLPVRLGWIVQYLEKETRKVTFDFDAFIKEYDTRGKGKLSPEFTFMIDEVIKDTSIPLKTFEYLSKLHPDFIPLDFLSSLLGVKGDSFGHLVGTLQHFSIIENVSFDQTRSVRGIKMHRLIQEETILYRNAYPKKSTLDEELNKQIVKKLEDVVKSQKLNVNAKKAMIPQIEHIMGSIMGSGILNKKEQGALYLKIYPEYEDVDHKKAFEFLKKAADLGDSTAQNSCGRDFIRTAQSISVGSSRTGGEVVGDVALGLTVGVIKGPIIELVEFTGSLIESDAHWVWKTLGFVPAAGLGTVVGVVKIPSHIWDYFGGSLTDEEKKSKAVEEAIKYFKMAAEQGDAYGQRNFGLFCYENKGDLDKAYEWYIKAHQNKYNNIAKDMKRLAEKGHAGAKKWCQENNPSGKALNSHEELPDYHHAFLTYHAQGVQEILDLRIRGMQGVVQLPFAYAQSCNMHVFREDFAKELNRSFIAANTALMAVNLYNEHWVGFIFTTQLSNGNIHAVYIDPENQSPPKNLEVDLRAALKEQSVIFTQNFVKNPQKYNSCGPKIIEELVAYIAGTEVQEEASIVPMHSALLEKELLKETSGASSRSFASLQTLRVEFSLYCVVVNTVQALVNEAQRYMRHMLLLSKVT